MSTCAGRRHHRVHARRSGHADVFYKVMVSGGTQVDLTITTGFVIQLRQLSCAGVGGCMANGYSTNGGGTPGSWWFFGVEHAAGDCGEFSISPIDVLTVEGKLVTVETRNGTTPLLARSLAVPKPLSDRGYSRGRTVVTVRPDLPPSRWRASATVRACGACACSFSSRARLRHSR